MTEQDFDKHETKLRRLSAEEIFGCFLAVFLLYGAAYILLAKPIARLKSLNPNNILEGCLYYKGTGMKNTDIGYIDGKKIAIYNMSVKQFPFKRRGVHFEKFNYCYKVQYIVVDFGPFTDSPYLNRYFLYDYIGK